MDKDSRFRGLDSSRELLEADLLNSRELVSKLNDDYYENQFKPQLLKLLGTRKWKLWFMRQQVY